MTANRYQSMDLLRSIAIMTVFLGHTVLSYGAPNHLAPLQFGGTGVDLFFVLSGWLLGGQLFKELNSTHTINLTRFWMRRWLRTLPAYYAVLLLSGLQRVTNDQSPYIPFEYLFFIQNYDYPLEFFTISWSLCVEEQFYLFIAPFLLITGSLKSLLLRTSIFLLMLTLPFIFRAFEIYQFPEETHVRWDGCLMGVLLAWIKYQHKHLWEKLEASSPILMAGGLFFYFLSYYNRWSPLSFWEDPDKLLLALMFGSWVIFANSRFSLNPKFRIPGVEYIALRSYSIYLLHPESLALVNRFFKDAPFVIYFSAALLICLAISEALYRLVEKPMIDLREKINLTR